MKSIQDVIVDDYTEYWRSNKNGEPLGVVLIDLIAQIARGTAEEEPMQSEGKVLSMFAEMYKAAWKAGFTARLSGVKGDDDGLSK
jgi:hypothetical protein